jgi:hypothetical protein
MHPSGIAESAAGFPHCGDCYQRLLSVSCDRCKQPIAGACLLAATRWVVVTICQQRAGAYVDLFGRKFHEECFCCDGCGERLTSSFVKRPAEKKALCRCVVSRGSCSACDSSYATRTHTRTRRTRPHRKCVGKQAAGGFVIDPRTGQKKFAT